ncbi:hypothetical protein T492DRAFT_850259 [Pavlovales sp. CCMP2436]|nr:hypothetical protein T492DRAFT_850259 [Pavlovales sp. CCMP2436]
MCLLTTACTPDDPRVWRWYASTHIGNNTLEEAADALERLLEAGDFGVGRELTDRDERKDGWFGAFYTLATVKENSYPSVTDVENASVNHTHTHAHTRTRAHAHTRTRAHAHTRKGIHTHTHAHTHPYIPPPSHPRRALVA